MSLFDALGELRDDLPRTPLPPVEGAGRELGGRSGIARHEPCGKERGRRVEIVRAERERIADRADAVTQMQLLFPHRVPEALGEFGDVDAPIVDEHDVDIALRAELRASVAADGDE